MACKYRIDRRKSTLTASCTAPTDIWTPLLNVNILPGCANFCTVWTGSAMLIWGGVNTTGYLQQPFLHTPAAPWISSCNRDMKFALLLLLACGSAAAGDLSRLRDDRAAVERVYYQHRLGDKPPFEQALPRATLEQLVQSDLRKESVLERVYHVKISPAQVGDEVRRIDTTTRAPEMLAEIKAALGNDPARFAQTVARPIVVERELRRHFENDDSLHAPRRREAEKTRNELLAHRAEGPDALVALLNRGHSNEVRETTWQLTARPARPAGQEEADQDLTEARKRFGPNAQILAPASADQGQKIYFEDLPSELQTVLRVQLRQAGDVSAVIETPDAFLLYVAREKTDAVLRVAGLALSKQSYEQWLQTAAGGGDVLKPAAVPAPPATSSSDPPHRPEPTATPHQIQPPPIPTLVGDDARRL